MAPWTYSLGQESPVYACLFMVFVLLAFVTVMNMLIGVLVEVVSVTAQVEKESNQVRDVKNVLIKLVGELVVDDDEAIGLSKNDFCEMLTSPGAAKALLEVGVDAVGLVDYAEFVYRKVENLSFGQVCELVLQLRGGNATKVQDLVDMRKFLHTELLRVEATVEKVHETMQTSNNHLHRSICNLLVKAQDTIQRSNN